MEPIASTYREVSHSKRGPLLIQTHPSVQRSMILLIFTNVFVAVIDFFFLPALYPAKRIHSDLNPSFIFSSHCRKRRRSAPFAALPQSSCVWGPCSRVERLCCTCLSLARSGTNDKHLDSAYGAMTAGEERG